MQKYAECRRMQPSTRTGSNKEGHAALITAISRSMSCRRTPRLGSNAYQEARASALRMPAFVSHLVQLLHSHNRVLLPGQAMNHHESACWEPHSYASHMRKFCAARPVDCSPDRSKRAFSQLDLLEKVAPGCSSLGLAVWKVTFMHTSVNMPEQLLRGLTKRHTLAHSSPELCDKMPPTDFGILRKLYKIII